MRLLALLLLVLGCHDEPPPTAQTPTPVQPLPAEVRLLVGSDPAAQLPMVVALHGRGSTPERFADFFDGATEPARLVLVEAPVEEGDGRAWFSFRGKGRAELAAEMRGLARQVLETTRRAMREHPTRGTPTLMGFSQGAMLVYVLALEHPGTYRRAVPVSGALFESFLPADVSNATPLIVLHGEDDPVIPSASGTRNLDALRRAGASVELRTFPGVRHWIARDMKSTLYEVLEI